MRLNSYPVFAATTAIASSSSNVSAWTVPMLSVSRSSSSSSTLLGVSMSSDEAPSPQVSDDGGGLSQLFATSFHAPVMATECVNALLGRNHERRHDERTIKKSERPGYFKQNAKPTQQPTAAAEEESVGPKIYVDGTLGGGGHSAALLASMNPGDILVGCDVDPSALATASRRLSPYIASSFPSSNDRPIFIPIQANFRNLANIQIMHPITGDLCNLKGNVDGLLLDLGVSSHQIDTPDRGFAFMKNGPLDMRMSNGHWNITPTNDTNNDTASSSSSSSVMNMDRLVANNNELNNNINSQQPYVMGRRGLTAADVCNVFDEEALKQIFQIYGDEPRARKIANSIVLHRPIATTNDLVHAISRVVPEFYSKKQGKRFGRISTMARVFQSLRIVVNDEYASLREALLVMAPRLVKRNGGRLVVLSYHSMEDRAAKRVMRDGTLSDSSFDYDTLLKSHERQERDMYGNVGMEQRQQLLPWKPLGKKVKASEMEVASNSRSRSATLRVAIRQ